MLSGLCYRFQDSIAGRELAAEGAARRRARARQNLAALKDIYVDMPEWKLLAFGVEAGLITEWERSEICDMQHWEKYDLPALRRIERFGRSW